MVSCRFLVTLTKTTLTSPFCSSHYSPLMMTLNLPGHAEEGRLSVSAPVFSWMTKQLRLFLPSQSRTGRDWENWEAGRGSTPSSHCPPRSLEQAAVSDPSGTGSFLQTTMCVPLPKLSTSFFPQQASNHMPLRPFFLPGKQFGVTWSRTAALLSRLWKCPACSSHLHVQPRLHIHGQGLRGALHNLCASGSL